MQASGELKVSQSWKSEPCDASSEIMLRYCLSRRGLALEQANVLSYSNHNKWMEKLLTSRLESAPTGFAKVTFQQLEAADKRLFVFLARRGQASGHTPMGDLVTSTLRSACRRRNRKRF